MNSFCHVCWLNLVYIKHKKWRKHSLFKTILSGVNITFLKNISFLKHLGINYFGSWNFICFHHCRKDAVLISKLNVWNCIEKQRWYWVTGDTCILSKPLCFSVLLQWTCITLSIRKIILFKKSKHKIILNFLLNLYIKANLRGASLAQLVEHDALDLRFLSTRTMLGVEIAHLNK